MSVDTELLVHSLRKRGHTVEAVIKVPDNAGDYEFIVDGATLTLEETRALLERDQAENPRAGVPPKTASTT
ncbi:MAG TPA: hypothetical protein VMD97_09570 [Candidatus Aquilonibacter sp.]|nr:hypothetical protein [Candidatus Aquilonibacter sp.]